MNKKDLPYVNDKSVGVVTGIHKSNQLLPNVTVKDLSLKKWSYSTSEVHLIKIGNLNIGQVEIMVNEEKDG